MSAGGPPELVRRLRASGVVFAEEEAVELRRAAAAGPALDALVARRCAGEPLEHVVGSAVLDGTRVRVHPRVFVPRRRTEAVLDAAEARPGPWPDPVRVLDLCCGSGALGLALARRLRARRVDVDLTLADVDPAAVACARENLAGTGRTGMVGARAVVGDLWAAVPGDLRGRLDVVLANVPYVPTAALRLLPREAREHEPRHTLDGGDDGLDVLRRVAAEAGEWLAPGGRLLSEISADQAAAANALLDAAGLHAEVRHDDARDTTVVAAARR